MSFRDVNLLREKRRSSNIASPTTTISTPSTSLLNMNMVRSRSVPITPPPAETEMEIQMAPPAKKTRPVVLHGKVLNVIDSEDMGMTHKTIERMQMKRTASREEDNVRQTFERRSAFSKLTHETQQFQKLVADLEGILEQSGESPEASWRARIIIRSAQEAEKDLWDKLYKYEQSLLAPDLTPYNSKSGSMAAKDKDNENIQKELRTAQIACMKLHRDFNRGHKVLVMILTLHEKRQKAEASRLRAVRWSGDKPTSTLTGNTAQLNQQFQDEDFFDRAMREREADMNRMNKSMHKVNEIYQEIAALVDVQQDDIDILDDNVRDSKARVQSSADEVNCLFERDRFCGAMDFGDMVDDDTGYEGEEKSESSLLPPEVREGEVFAWYMPFENIGEDMGSVHRDIVRMGKDILQKGGEYTCESKSSRY
jgi:hypothetical protein